MCLRRSRLGLLAAGWVVARCFFFFSSRRRHTRLQGDWSSDVCSSDLDGLDGVGRAGAVDQNAFLPDRGTGFGEGRVHLLLGRHVHVAVNTAKLAGQRLADGFVHVEDGDLDAMAGQTPGRGGPQAGSPPGDDGRNVGIELHGFSLKMTDRRYWPVNLGVRLPRNAACPSRLSAERKATTKLRFSCSRPCASGVSKLARAASFASATASGELAAIRQAIASAVGRAWPSAVTSATMPTSHALRASMKSPVSSSAMALDLPMA